MAITIHFAFCLLLSILHSSSTAIDVTEDVLREMAPGRQRLLENVTFRCCAVLAPPFVFENPNRHIDYDGWSVRHFEALQEVSGFKCGSLRTYEGQEAGSAYNDFIQMLGECTLPNGTVKQTDKCYCDIGIGSWWQNPARLVANFLPAHGYDEFSIVVHVNDTNNAIPHWFFVSAFPWSIWISILALSISFITLAMLDSISIPVLPREQDTCHAQRYSSLKNFLLRNWFMFRLRRAVQNTSMYTVFCPHICFVLNPTAYIRSLSDVPVIFFCLTLSSNNRYKVSNMIGYSTPDIPDGVPRRFTLGFLVRISGLFFILVYESSMTAILVDIDHRSAFKTVDDLRNCKIRYSEICFAHGDSSETFWNNAIARDECQKKFGVDDKPQQMLSNDLIDAVANRSCKFLLADGGLASQAVSGKYCNTLVHTGKGFLRRSVSFPIPPNWTHSRALRQATVQAQQNAMVGSFKSYVDNKGSCQPYQMPQMEFRRLHVFFIVVAVASLAVFLEMALDPQRDS